MAMTRSILVVDDDPCACDGLAEQVRHFGFKVECVHSCAEAVGRLRKRHYDGLLLDFWMQDGRGDSVLGWLRENGRREPVIMMSAVADYDLWIDLVNSGAADLIPKPVEEGQLKRSLQLAMGGRYFIDQGWSPA